MESTQNQTAISSAPHIHNGISTNKIMWFVIIALLPATIFGIISFKIPAMIHIVSGILGGVIAETAFQFFTKQKITITDGSAVITGLLVAFNVPPNAYYWIPAVGAAFGIIIAKHFFGGLGNNIFNPALVGRAFLLASWPVQMTTKWLTPAFAKTISGFSAEGVQKIHATSATLSAKTIDALTSATPLAIIKYQPENVRWLIYNTDYLKNLLFGNTGGCIGETSAILLFIGGLFLIFKKIISYHIPLAYILTVFMLMSFSSLISKNGFSIYFPLIHILAGGLFLGAFFMATDMVTSPLTHKGMLIFGIGCGILTCIIRIFGGYPEGVSYSILIMNAVTPLIDRFIKNQKFGFVKT